MSAYEFTLTGDPEMAKQTAVNALQAREFVLHWHEEWSGRAIKGSKLKAALVGAFSPYVEIGVKVMALDGGLSVVRIDQLTTGWMSGIIGARKTDKVFVTLKDELVATFGNAGVLHAHGNPAAQAGA